jgi:hypothetical protein
MTALMVVEPNVANARSQRGSEIISAYRLYLDCFS